MWDPLDPICFVSCSCQSSIGCGTQSLPLPSHFEVCSHFQNPNIYLIFYYNYNILNTYQFLICFFEDTVIIKGITESIK